MSRSIARSAQASKSPKTTHDESGVRPSSRGGDAPAPSTAPAKLPISGPLFAALQALEVSAGRAWDRSRSKARPLEHRQALSTILVALECLIAMIVRWGTPAGERIRKAVNALEASSLVEGPSPPAAPPEPAPVPAWEDTVETAWSLEMAPLSSDERLLRSATTAQLFAHSVCLGAGEDGADHLVVNGLDTIVNDLEVWRLLIQHGDSEIADTTRMIDSFAQLQERVRVIAELSRREVAALKFKLRVAEARLGERAQPTPGAPTGGWGPTLKAVGS